MTIIRIIIIIIITITIITILAIMITSIIVIMNALLRPAARPNTLCRARVMRLLPGKCETSAFTC